MPFFKSKLHFTAEILRFSLRVVASTAAPLPTLMPSDRLKDQIGTLEDPQEGSEWDVQWQLPRHRELKDCQRGVSLRKSVGKELAKVARKGVGDGERGTHKNIRRQDVYRRRRGCLGRVR